MKNIMNIFALVFVTLLSACQVSLEEVSKVEQLLDVPTSGKISTDIEIRDITIIGVSPDEKVHITYYE